MVRKGAAREALGGHERQAEQHDVGDELGDGQRRHLRDERAGRERGVVLHPRERRFVDARRGLRERDDHAPDHRLAPDDPSLPRQHEQAERDPAADIQHDERQRAGDADGGVDRAHLLVAPGERVRNLDEVGDLGQLVAADDQPQTEAAFAEPSIGALVDEGVIDPAGRCAVPAIVRPPETAPGRRSRRVRLSIRRVRAPGPTPAPHPGASSRNRSTKPFGVPSGANVSVTSFFSSSLKCRTRQRYGVYKRIGRERGEGRLAAALELDERLHRLVDAERRGVAEVRRTQAPLGRQQSARGRAPPDGPC